MISNTDYEKLLIENRKSFREALRRQRKANAILHAENERLKAMVPVQEYKPESEDSEQVRLINWIGTMYMTQHGAKNIHELMKKQGFEITKKR